VGVAGVICEWQSVHGHDDPSTTVSMEINFAPAAALAQTSLSDVEYTGAEGFVSSGIFQFRKRATPSGPDQDVNFFGVSPAAVTDPLMTSVTALFGVSPDQAGTFTLTVWIFD
jgi:hypothetical protein